MDPRISDTRIKLVRNDTGPQVQLTLTDEATGSPVDLTGASATLHFKSITSGAVVFSRGLVIPSPTAASGTIFIVWAAGDLDQPAGDYEGEVEVTFPQSLRQTVYDTLRFRIREQFV